MDMIKEIKRLQGPILVLGGSGFVGANLLRTLLGSRDDVFGTTTRYEAWRLEGVPREKIISTDLLVDANLDNLLEKVKPRTIFNCAAYGAYSFETDSQLIFQTNFNLVSKVLERLDPSQISCFIQAGSSSEYGDNGAGPVENSPLSPNSDYSVSKAACANLILFYGKKKRLPCANLRLYSVYGPMEDYSRLIPTVIQSGIDGRYPNLVDPDISRDFVYIDDVCAAFVACALHLRQEDYGESFNIGTGRKTSIREVALAARDIFNIPRDPVFNTMPDRHWDMKDWFADVRKAKERLVWEARTSLKDGLSMTVAWYRGLVDKEKYRQASKQFQRDAKYSVSAVIACYKDNQAIPVMYEQLKSVFEKLNVDYEIIFVNDGSPDESEETIRAISLRDRRVIGISHSRNFGSQASFKSGMEISSKNSCVLLDGDLQDPPELIEQFVAKWRQGYDVVYGRRGKREGTLFMQSAAKVFYMIFDYFSYIPMPHDAGDFSLLDKRVVDWILEFPERELFLRGVRAFVGFKQIGVDYYRPKRMFGESTNNLLSNINWAKKGIFSFSTTPLNILSFSGSALFLVTILLAAAQLVSRLFFPELSPRGITTVLLAILFFGSLNLLALAILGEYIAKISEEVKRRPSFIRRSIIRFGEVRFAAESQRPSNDRRTA